MSASYLEQYNPISTPHPPQEEAERSEIIMIVVPVYDEGVRIRLMVYFIININLVGAGLLSGCK